MTLAVHLVCAVVSAARAIEEAESRGFGEDAKGACGDWRAMWIRYSGTLQLYSNAVVGRMPTDYRHSWSETNWPLATLSGDDRADFGEAHWPETHPIDEDRVSRAIELIRVRFGDTPEVSDWRTWEPTEVPA